MENFSNIHEISIKDRIENSLTNLGLNFIKDKPKYDKESFIKTKKVSIEAIKSFFEANNYLIKDPIPLVLQNGTTLFVSAGIQVLEKVIHEEAEYPETPIFVNQPVLRTQFLGNNAIESHTSFHNITTLDINISFENHVEHIKKWIEYLISVGFEKGKILLQIIESTPRIGNIKYSNIVVKIFYGGLEIGDAVYIPSMPQKSRPSFSISDIGFGLERLQHNPEKDNTVENDCLKTLALLSISGVEPSNRNQGYRFRLFSKEFVSRCKLDFGKMLREFSKIENYIDLWSIPTGNINRNNLSEKIKIECERNFNREILNYLKAEFNYDHNIEINQPTKNFLIQLINIGDEPKEFWDVLIEKINFK